MAGQEVAAEVERVVDGDTVRVLIEGRSLSLRLQNLDTEESRPGGGKPVTPWGKEASAYVTRLLAPGDAVTVRLQSETPLFNEAGEVAPDHLDNFKRLLGLLFLSRSVDDGGPASADFQQLMLRQGYSPYFVKYGRVPFADLDRTYAAAERVAQAGDLGVWNQLLVNGSVARDYPLLAVWWELRAQLIDGFRLARDADTTGDLLNSRRDYETLRTRAATGDVVTVFLELREATPIGRHALIDTGSLAQPFKLFIPQADSPERAPVMTLLSNRYLSSSENPPRRNYAYVTGPLKLWRGAPELELTGIDQLSDSAPPAVEV